MTALRSSAKSRTASEPAHDWLHVLRVEGAAVALARSERADEDIVRAAALLHEVVNLPKSEPASHRSGELCAEVALTLLRDAGVAEPVADTVAHCIRIHAFSAGIAADTIEARVLQDADRLDAIGAIGVARCFATCASMGRPFYHGDDPFAEHRDLDDRAFGLDHFYRKLLRLEAGMHTRAGRDEGARRTAFLHQYLEQLRKEIEPAPLAQGAAEPS